MQHFYLKDIVDEVSVRENNPSSSGYDRFIGLEHYVSGEVEIHDFGSTSNLASAMKVFKSGDILIARRNVYLRRAGIVKFDGLTSGDSIVLRAKNERIAKLLPFIFNTSEFWDYADQNADGTMSKRLSPRILLEYEINLPEPEEQEKLADLLWAAEETRQAYKKLIKQTDDLVKAKFKEMFYNKNYPFKTIGEVIDKNIKRTTKVFDADDIIKYLDISSIDNSTNTVKGLTNYRVKDAPSRAQNVLQENDILYSTVRPNLKNIAINPYKGNDIVGSSGFCVLRCTGVPTLYMYAVVTSDEFTNAMVSSASGANYPAVTDKIVHAYSIPIPPEREQIHFVEFLQQAEQTKLATQQSLDALNEAVRALVNRNFN